MVFITTSLIEFLFPVFLLCFVIVLVMQLFVRYTYIVFASENYSLNYRQFVQKIHTTLGFYITQRY